MNTPKPQYLQALTILFWGYQTELLWFALPMAIILEARYFVNRRWALTTQDFYRVADLTSVGLAAMVLFLFMNRQEYHFITTLLAWIPILLFPLVAVLAYSTTPRMTLDVLFYSLRRQREPVQQTWDMDYVLLGACLLAASFNQQAAYFYPVAGLILFSTLFQLRSQRFSNRVVVLSLSLVFLAATAMHTGIRGAHLSLKKQTELWIANWIAERTDPLKTRTALGKVGQLKLSDAIAFRIAPASGEPDFPARLMEAVYNTSSGTDWEVFNPQFANIDHADDFTWRFIGDPVDSYPKARIYLEFDREKSLIPVPMEVVEVDELPATDLSVSEYGSVQGVGLIRAPYFQVRYDNQLQLGSPPTATDLEIPVELKSTLEQALTASGQENPVGRVQAFFNDFRYTLYQSEAVLESNPISHFLLESKAGHCEYFASTTTLLLRHLGVPARYVVGFSIQEWNNSLGMYVVRQRHAHAWAIAYINNQWVAVDTTPQQWLAMEESHAGLLQPVWDFFANGQFRFTLWWNDQKLEDYERELYAIGAILLLILIWRIATSEQVILERKSADDQPDRLRPGQDSPFFRVEETLQAAGYARGPGELMASWLLRIERPELLPMLATHYRWRFDPRGVSMEQKARLADQVSDWLAANETQDADR